MEKELMLTHVPVIFAELEDKGFGKSITIDAGNFQEEIKAWVKANNINGGEAKFKEYTDKDGKTTIQYNFKISKYTEIDGRESADVGFGAIINLIARAYDYDNQFGKGTSASLKAVFVVEPKIDFTMDKIKE